jgi:hypothetical protein
MQGELAHHTVKQLYGRTNKWDATKQIGQHVRCLKLAQLATDHQSINKQSKTQTASGNDDLDQDLVQHYQISKSQKDIVDLYSYIYENAGDPTFNVCFHIPISWSEHLSSKSSIEIYPKTQRSLTWMASQLRL